MKIYLHEISDQESEFDFSQDEKWVRDAVERVDEDDSRAARQKERPVQVHFSLRKVDDVVIVSGDVDTHLRLLCSRCAASFQYPCQMHFSGLYCRDPVMAGVAHLEGKGKPAGQNKGFARHAHDHEVDKMMDQGTDLDITYLNEDVIDLSDVLTEQLQLQLPFQPLCKQECKGMCSNCGADLNVGRCACSKINATSPFSVLKDLKV